MKPTEGKVGNTYVPHSSVSNTKANAAKFGVSDTIMSKLSCAKQTVLSPFEATTQIVVVEFGTLKTNPLATGNVPAWS